MILKEEQTYEFEKLTKPLIKWLNENCHPHTTVIIDYDSAELSEGICAIRTKEFIRD